MTDRPGDFAALFDAMRHERNFASQKAFARHAKISQAQLSQLISGARLLSNEVCDKLVDAFPEFEGRLRTILDSHQHLDHELDALRHVDSLLERGRPLEARVSLERILKQSELSPSVLAEAHARLAAFAFDDHDVNSGIDHYRDAIAAARKLRDAQHVTSYLERLALRLTQAEMYEIAQEFLIDALQQDLYHTALWRRLGIVYWYGDALVEAYGALTVALSLGHRRLHVLHARGQVLAELGQTDAAISELTEFLDNPSAPLAAAYARSSRAWAYAQSGAHDAALGEFAAAEAETPGNSWLHFFRARCYDECVGDRHNALDAYRLALEFNAPPLTLAKRAHALARIAALTE